MASDQYFLKGVNICAVFYRLWQLGERGWSYWGLPALSHRQDRPNRLSLGLKKSRTTLLLAFAIWLQKNQTQILRNESATTEILEPIYRIHPTTPDRIETPYTTSCLPTSLMGTPIFSDLVHFGVGRNFPTLFPASTALDSFPTLLADKAQSTHITHRSVGKGRVFFLKVDAGKIEKNTFVFDPLPM